MYFGERLTVCTQSETSEQEQIVDCCIFYCPNISADASELKKWYGFYTSILSENFNLFINFIYFYDNKFDASAQVNRNSYIKLVSI